jgi:hypothetical protein
MGGPEDGLKVGALAVVPCTPGPSGPDLPASQLLRTNTHGAKLMPGDVMTASPLDLLSSAHATDGSEPLQN